MDRQGLANHGLVSVAKKQFKEQGKEIFLIDDDMYRRFYPKSDEIIEECPEFYTKLTAIGSSSVTPKLLKYASDKGLNFIFDGTMKNPRIIETAMTWNDYKINWKVMATSKLESLISVFERNDYLRRNGDCRFITADVHNETYSGLVSTVMNLESIENMGTIQVYTRGNRPDEPLMVYDSTVPNEEYKTAVAALNGTRKQNKKLCIKNGVMERLEKLKHSDIPRNMAELDALGELEKSINDEIER